ncbi:unnamed protein product [Cuscuta campestris]|uniref:alcohol dehydrogenase n=2 Tax=Cuscuta sect. Cleistogrammica TaxID=1824901 RepID=A0A484JZ46_9ASTE|nr:hypothetical protein DM860_008753 [Cuscuta australis]VFQ58691.1 unnamed protein product [Cuscuta campestris]
MATTTAGKVIKCKAALAWGHNRPLQIQEVEVAPPEENEVRIKVMFTSLCKGDIHYWKFHKINRIFPRILGHEGAGIVESVGEGVTEVAPGDHVLTVFTGECGGCDHCLSEESNLCSFLTFEPEKTTLGVDDKSRFSYNGVPVYHFAGTSTFSEYTVVNYGCLVKLDPKVPMNKICVLGCGIAAGLGAVLNVAKPKRGSTVAIFGLGDVGLAAAEGARISGASKIIGVDTDPSTFTRALAFGVTVCLNHLQYDKSVQEVIADMTDGGADRSVECSGETEAMIAAFECVHQGWGMAVLVGVPNMECKRLRLDTEKVVEGRTVTGSFFGNYKARSQLPQLVQMYMNQELELDKFIKGEVALSEINEAFDGFVRGQQGLRPVIRMQE